MLPEPDEYAGYFHETFREHPEAIKKRMEWKKLKKKSKARSKHKNRIEMFADDYHLPPEIELPSNASAFATFASIRLAVFDRWMKHANQEYLQSSCSAPLQDQSEIESDTEDNTQSSTFMPIKLSKIVGLGLRSVFEIIKESRTSHPNLCTKALSALHDVLQGQTPEGLKLEPNDVVDPLFELLLDLATLHGPESSVPNNGTHLTAIACACLLSLVVVRGDTGKYLSATAALLMCPRSLSLQNIQMPSVLSSLQRSVHGVLLGKIQRPDWITHGIPTSSKIDSFHLITKNEQLQITPKSLAMDGLYLYLYTSKGLFKIGSGYGGTLKGHVYAWKPDFYPNDNGSLVYCAGKLYLKLCGRRGVEFLIVERNDLLISGSVPLHSKDSISSVVFSDGEHLGTISPTKDDGFVIRMLNQNTLPASVVSELPLKLARKCVEVLGTSSFEDEGLSHTVNTGNDDEIASICAGKEFGLIRTTSGKVLYCGKSSALGIKQSGVKSCKWSELSLTKSPKITHVSVGHDGLHAILLTEDGSVFFTGTARRGEDGDQSKVRRQPKSIKPKKIIKVDGQFIISSACNNGTTALVTRDGELLMFGKDTTHCDPSTGVVYTLKGEFIAQVSLGKAHAVALTSKGQVYTFGINNKYQCGREFTPSIKDSSLNIVAMDTCATQDDQDVLYEDLEVKEMGNSGSSDGNNLEPNQLNMCPAGMHSWHDDRCMICTICRECTGYSISCLSSISERNPGQECGCGEGDSGCSICGCCRICAREVVDNSELADLAGMMRLDVIFRDKILIQPRQRSKLQEQIQSRLEERKKGRKSIAGPSSKQNVKMKITTRQSPSSSSQNSTHNRSNNLMRGNNHSSAGNSKEQLNSDIEQTRIACLPPAKIQLPCETTVIQISCGQHHSLLLCQNGQVYSFGSNLYGQLGCGDILAKNSIQLVKLPCSAIHVAAGNNHSVVLTSKGEVYTFGNHQKGQLGRFQPNSPQEQSCSKFTNPRTPWYAIPSNVPNIGPRHGRRATWVGASGDQTFIKIDESLINSVSISKSTVTANRNSLVLIPNYEETAKSFSCLVINKRDGSCNSFKGREQASFCGKSICLDPLYNVLWSYNPQNHQLECFNVTLSELSYKNKISDKNFKLTSISSPELSLPLATNCYVTRFQAALNLLCCLDTLTVAHELQMSAVKEENDERHQMISGGKQYSKEDYQVINRFESHGGGWGYSGHSIEAIRFMADTDILLGGFGLFGGRGEYTAKLKLLDIGPEGGEQEGDGELLSETEEIPYECGPRQKYSMLFDEPISLQAHRWYIAWCRISGPSSDCGSSGQTMVTSEDQVLFYFKSSKKSNNGTDVNAGQIPQLLKDFSRTVTKECFQSLLSLLQWSWNTFKWGVVEGQNIKNVYTKLEINEIYPSQVYKKILLENVNLAECIGEVRGLLKQILSDNLASLKKHKIEEMSNEILEESHNTFVACFHAFYPTAFLKWTCLCDLLCELEKESLSTGVVKYNSQRLLSAVLCALCAPNVRLRTTFPLLACFITESSLHKGLSPSDNTGLPMMSGSDSHHYPILVEQMSYRTQMESSCGITWTWKEILERLLNLVSDPVFKKLEQSKTSPLPELTRHCCHLLGRVVAELVHQCNATEDELQSGCGRILHVTPSRFTRTNQSRTWNTGNGSPDAVCFQVDRPGISIAGVGVYGGIGHYEYEVELLEDSSTVGNSDSHGHTQRWNSLEVTRGSFGPEDFAPDIIEIKFDRAVPVKENFKYAIRLRNHGGRTNNGDGGLNSVKGSDGTNFIFSTCALSFNGTTLTRGQIPVLLYYSNPLEYDGKSSSMKLEQQARKAALSMTSSIIRKTCNLMTFAREKVEEVSSAEILSDSSMVTTLLPFVIAHISPLATSDPRSAVYILGLIYELLPHVAALNLIGGSAPGTAKTVSSGNECSFDYRLTTTSHHYIWVQSEHPYKPATVSNYRAKFPESVKWMSLEFDPACSTVQPEDTLQLYVPALEGAESDMFEENCGGFGESPPFPHWPVLHKFSGCLQWPSNAIILPGNEVIFSLETASDYLKDEKANAYGFKCLVIGYEWPLPGMNAPLSGLKHLESELAFLGGMCAASLMKKELQLPTFGDEADIDVDMAEIIASETFSMHSQLLSKGLALSNPPTVNQALDGMIPYSVHSNERLFLRDFVSCTSGSSGGRLAEWLQPGSRVDPSKCQVLYSRDELRCGWPAVITLLTRDQYSDLVHVPNMKVEIKAIPIDKKELGDEANRKIRRVVTSNQVTTGPTETFETASSSAHPPNLQFPYEPTVKDKMYFHSITVMKPYQNYSFEELRYMSPPVKRTSENMLVRPNLDGTYSATWTPASIGCYSIVVNIDGYEMEEIFKVEVKEPPQGMIPPTQHTPKKTVHQPNKLRKFVAKNSAGLRVRAHPSLQSEQIGIVHVNGTIAFIDEIHNDDGVWLRLSMDTIKQYCNSGIIEAWCLQYNQHLGKTLLLPVEEPKTILDQVISNTIRKKLPEIHDRKKLPENACKEYVVIKCGASGHNVRNKPNLNAPRVGMLVLGNRIGVDEYIVNSEGCWVLLDEATREKYCFNTEEEAWSLAMSHNDTLYLGSIDDDKSSGEKGFDFTQTDALFFSKSPLKQQSLPDSFSQTNPFFFGDNCENVAPKIPKREGKISALPKWFKSDETKSDLSDDENPQENNRTNGNGTPPETPKRSRSPKTQLEENNTIEEHGGVKKLTQTGTQTSPENLQSKGHFSIGSAILKEDKLSPKLLRKERPVTKARPKRAISPGTLHQPGTSSPKIETAKLAMSPSLAEALRAVFAAFLWHEGIVHDAMACASFLKFHPTLPKQGALVVTRNHPEVPPVNKRKQELSKEEKARQRHSVEVTNAGNYLHIQPATLESLTRSAANANANRNKLKKITHSITEEEAAPKENTEKSNFMVQTVSVLPPALKSLVYLWEELSSSCFQTITQQMVIQSPLQGNKARNNEQRLSNNTKNDNRDKSSTIEKDSKKNRKKKIVARNYLEDIGIPTYVASNESETVCELCGEIFPHPVTYHMHQSHPGCGQHAGGKGYNSGGNYCLGWAGNCGDGGVPGSSWYLLCETCREKYVKAYRNGKQFTNRVKNLQRRIYVKPSMPIPSLLPGLEPHVIMKNNAMFLLDLASSSESNLTNQRRSSTSFMPSLSENNSPPDFYGPFSPVPPFQCLQSLGAQHENEPDIYEVIMRKQNVQDGFTNFSNGQRPLSEVSEDFDAFKGTRFHRSISMGTNGIPWTKSDGRVIMTRRRNNSNCESTILEGGSSLLCNPSSALQHLIPKTNAIVVIKKDINNDENDDDDDDDRELSLVLLQRPVMQFLMQQHDLESLKLSMRQALRKASCRVYAMQALNWLLKSVTQPLSLHDLLWWFVTSLTPSDYEVESEDDNRPAKKLEEDLNVCEHPLSDILIGGDAVHPLPGTFHALLQTIADLMVLLPMGSSLQQIAVRCWGLRFASSDHSFLHRSQVFSNISKILSRSEELEDCTLSMHESLQNSQQSTSIECSKDLTHSVEIKSSSRQAMVGSLIDGSTETFWESGDEDRNKTKSLLLVVPQGYNPALICVHIDNCRDLGNKVSSISFYSGLNSDELTKLRSVEVETRLGGWVNCPIPTDNENVVKIELKGPDNSVRVRQVRLLGSLDSDTLKVGKQFNSYTIQQRNCEGETLRVFRLITAQVFGKLIQGGNFDRNYELASAGSGSESIEPLEDSNDLREHMVGILFSRSKLTHLQKQVIVHIVQAIRKETIRVREEWEMLISSTGSSGLSGSIQSQENVKNSDTYCFEMLSMVLALSGSSVGRAYLSHQNGLLGDLLSLLHTGSARVQRQVTSLLRRMLPEISPEIFAKVMGVTNLPPKDFNDVVLLKSSETSEFDIHKQGILDVFLSVIAKSLTVQVKFKGKTGTGGVKEINTVTLATSVHPKDYLGTRWWLRGFVNKKLSEVIVSLIKDMASGKLSESWARISKGAIAENILNLTHLSEEQRVPNVCLRTPTLWIALASLCVLDKDHVERLSSGQWSSSEGGAAPAPPRPTCTNHDDGETTAVIQCNNCGNLCADCDRFLHLHRKTRFHQRQVCKEEEEAIKVELHEGCGRTKLFWLLALADARTLKALIEYRDGGNRTRGAGTSGVCRFCGATGTSGLLAIGNVCADQECQEYSKTACLKLLNCGHMCGGVMDEEKCLPCLHGCSNEPTLRQDADDMCMICFTEALSCAPSVQLKCGHVFHLHCCKTVLAKKWAGPRITFSFSQCPICKENMEHAVLSELLEPVQKLYKDVRRKALMRLEYEGLHTVEAIATPGARFYNDPASYAMDRYAYYVCFKCNKAYYGGEARCDVELGGENYDPTELVCGACSDVARAQMCPKHGTDFLEYKCRYCCSVAVFFCFGTTHFCNPCHDDFQRVTNLAKNELPNCPAGPKAKQLEGDECPLHVKHPATGEEFALGCGVCRNAHTF